MAPAVLFEHVRKSFAEKTAVDDLDLEVPRGTVYGLLGPNGAGKTTSIRMLMGILHPDAGSIRVLDARPGDAPRDRIGYLPEERGLYPGMRVMDDLVFFAAIHGVPPGDARRRAGEWLDRLRMADTAGQRLQELSKGNHQKIQFIATVLHEPDLLVLDEPFSGLDPVNQDLVRQTMLDLARAGTTIILSTHLMDEVERLCSRITLIHRGRAVVAGELDEVKGRWGADTIRLDLGDDGAFLDAHEAVEEVSRIGRTLELRLRKGIDPSAFLAEIASRVPVRRFEVRAPSLHRIFVRLVGEPEVPAPTTATAPPAGIPR